MAEKVCKKFTWMIKDFYYYPTDTCYCDPILIDDCEWNLSATEEYNSLRLFLGVSDPKSLPSGWRRYVKLRLSVATNYSGELELLKEMHFWFDQKNTGWSFPATLPITELFEEEEWFLVNGELTIVSETQESIDVNGFKVHPSQAEYVRCIFERHPDIAVGFRAKNQHLRITSMDFLLSLIETLCLPLQDLSDEVLVDADITLTILKDVGFKVDWLEGKLDQVKEKKVKEEFSFARLRELEDSLLKLQLKCSDLNALVEKEEAELSATRAPLSFDDVV